MSASSTLGGALPLADAPPAALALMVGSVLLIGLVVPWLANAYWIKTLTSSLALSIAAAGVALLYGQLGLAVSYTHLTLPTKRIV